MKSLYIFAVYILITTLHFAAYGQHISREKKIYGRFPAEKGKLVIDNRYGKLDVNTWDKNEVTVSIIITAKARSEGDAREILDKINIIEPHDRGNGIYYKTVIQKMETTTNKSEFTIDYIINMPQLHTAEFFNKYGDIEISDIGGKLLIDLEYGDLKTGAIKGGDKDIRVGFGSAAISSMETGVVTSSYSRISIDKAGSIKVSNQFGKTTISTVRNLDIEQKYGDLKVGTVNQLKGNVQYAGISVNRLLKSVQMTLKYSGGARFEYIGPDVDQVDINASFSNLFYHFDDAASLSADINIAFGNVSNDANNMSLTRSSTGETGHNSIYRGKVGGGRGNMTLDVSYGNVLFR